MTNPLKKKLSQDGVLLGLFNGLVGNYTAEICAGSNYDWICIDGEHAPFDLRTIISQHQIMAAHSRSIVVRPPDHDSTRIRQLLDAGIQSFMIPRVENADTARAIAAVMHYPPKGVRGMGTGMSRAAQWNRDPDYISTASNELVLMIQVESLKGLEQLEAICDEDGVDVVFIGPADLAASMGWPGQENSAEVVSIVTTAINRIARMGKAPGVMTLNPSHCQVYADAGAKLIAAAVDTLALTSGLDTILTTFRAVS